MEQDNDFELSLSEWFRQEALILFEFVGWAERNDLKKMNVAEWEEIYRNWHDSEEGEVPKSLSDPVKK